MATAAHLPSSFLPRPRRVPWGRILRLALVPGAAGATGAVPALAAVDAQARLVAVGLLAPAEVTGRWDAETVAAVRRFQAQRDLVVDGVAGAATADRLLAA